MNLYNNYSGFAFKELQIRSPLTPISILLYNVKKAMNKNSKHIICNLTYEKLIVLLLLITITPYFFLALFSVPSADDFSQALQSINEGVMGFVSSRYLNWSGRYSSDLVISTFNVLGNKVKQNFLIQFYYTVPISIISIYFISCYLFISLIAKESKSLWRIFFAILSTILMLSYVEIRSTVFWLAGGATYTLGNALFLVSLAITLSSVYIEHQSRKVLSLVALNVILIFFLNGFNEIIMVCNTVIILGLILFGYLFKSINKSQYLRLLLFATSAIVSSFIVIFAPGNSVRVAQDGKKLGILQIILKSLWAMIDNIFHWINPLWICFCLIVFLTGRYFVFSNLELYISNKRKFIPLLGVLFLALYLSYCVRYYSLGFVGPLRANSVSYLIFFLLTYFLCLYGYTKYGTSGNLRRYDNQHIFIVILIYCFLSTVINFRLIAKEFSVLKNHYVYYQTIYPKLISGNPEDNILVPPEPEVSILRWKCYLTDDYQYWTNQAVANYFDINTVKAEGAKAPDYECGNFKNYQKNRTE